MFATQVTVRERAVDSMLPQLLRNARERFLENTQPIIKFLCGEAACADIVLADKDLLRVLVGDGLPAAGGDGPGGMLSASDAARLRAEWRVSMPELNEKFAVWWALNGLGNAKTPRPPSIVSRDVFKIAEQHLGVKVERDTHARVDYMYGIKLLSSVQHGGNQNMTYG
jgi:hypothetical protein